MEDYRTASSNGQSEKINHYNSWGVILRNLDIIFVSYNSEKWITNCLKSLENQTIPKKNIFITFVDNNSTDNTRVLLSEYENKELFGGFQCHLLDQNLGFGKANNYGVKYTLQDYVLFLNIDTELEPNALEELMDAAVSSNNDVGLWECRQFPYEHPKNYDPVTLELTWASGAACMVRRDIFVRIGMFDEKIFMYAEDVDLSWRLRAYGFKLIYVPKSIVHHYTYESAGQVKPNQFYNSTYNNLMLRYKFGSMKDIIKGYMLYYSLFFNRVPFSGHKKTVLKKMIKSISEGQQFRAWKRKNKTLVFEPSFLLWDYEIIRDGAFYVNTLPEEKPLVSILIRTCGRPAMLREALQSVRNQTYTNIEVVIVEDGPDISRGMIEKEFNDLTIQYYATEAKVGRCVVGNIAMEKANGKYLNFLDDDDVLYADHIEVLCYQLLNNPDKKAAYAHAFETPVKIISRDPYEYIEMFHNVQHRQPFNRLILIHHNYFPIQCVLFSKELFTELGGIDTELEVLEDWDLWLKYALQYDFHYVEKVTSTYRVPYEMEHHADRQQLFDKYLQKVRGKYTNQKTDFTLGDWFNDAEQIINRPQSIVYAMRRMTLKTFVFKVKNKVYMKIKKLLK
ncbi:glycosyltransferase family 2 protein [Paenibacillus sp. NPDC058174]|uniref:glycosyltransferase family 2 protein n=1 Tax=Paenibacillus sp. NPDC058174 TaxID=3346366 RepID=UPI0036DF2B4B